MPFYGLAIPHPAFPLVIGVDAAGILRIEFGTSFEPPHGWERQDGQELIRETARQLAEYFEGARRRFELPLDLRGTPFQKRVWEALLKIPYGETSTYRQLARKIGSPGAARAVGGANHANPVPIVVPCHRVVNAGGGLGGYGGGIDRKRWLLDLESRNAEKGAQPVLSGVYSGR